MRSISEREHKILPKKRKEQNTPNKVTWKKEKAIFGKDTNRKNKKQTKQNKGKNHQEIRSDLQTLHKNTRIFPTTAKTKNTLKNEKP